MKQKFLAIAAATLLLTACGSKESKTAETTDGNQTEATATDDESSSDDDELAFQEDKWTINPADPALDDDLSEFIEIVNEPVAIKEMGGGDNVYYVITPKFNVIKANDKRLNAINIKLLDESGSPISYSYELAGNEYTSDLFASRNRAAIEKALKAGEGTVEVPFQIRPKDMTNFDISMIDNAREFVVSGAFSSL